MSRNLSFGLIGTGVVILVIALLEHWLVTVRLVPHLAIFLGVAAVVVAGVGIYGLLVASRNDAATKSGNQVPQWPDSTPRGSA